MHILILTPRFSPSIGGVEQHLLSVLPYLSKVHTCTVVTELDAQHPAPAQEKTKTALVYRLAYPHKKILGLATIWHWLWKNRQLIAGADVIHIHDVFIWYLPFRFIFPTKRILLTLHGWEGIWPIPLKNRLYKQIAVTLAHKSVAIGSFIEKFYGVKPDIILYGGVSVPSQTTKTHTATVVYVGRLAQDTGLPVFLKALENLPKQSVIFCGDGPLRSRCEELGTVTGFVADPSAYMQSATTIIASGYLTILQALSLKKRVVVAYDNPLKKYYYEDSPFANYISICKNASEISAALVSEKQKAHKALSPQWESAFSWQKVAIEYLHRYKQLM